MKVQRFQISSESGIQEILDRARPDPVFSASVEEVVERIIEDVSTRGDAALLDYSKSIDGVELSASMIEVRAADRLEAWRSLDDSTRTILKRAESRIADFAKKSLPSDWHLEHEQGMVLGQTTRPLAAAGIYVPGGRFPYPSTVLMAGIPAREAGVPNIIICAPPTDNGEINRITLAATTLLPGCRVFRIGGAQAVAAMALGTETVPACNLVAGPGNIYVATAKRILSDVVSIDVEAGPSEIAVYVDEKTNLSFAVADLLAQLEHDPQAVAVVISESAVAIERIESLAAGLAAESGYTEPGGSIIAVEAATPALSLALINELAPEHLSIMTDDAREKVERIESAGCIFIGEYSAVALGDYMAGPSHVLPTAGTARRLSGLNAASFLKTINLVEYTDNSFQNDAMATKRFAEIEGLKSHAFSIEVRQRHLDEAN